MSEAAVTWWPLSWRDRNGALHLFEYTSPEERLHDAVLLARHHDAYDLAFPEAFTFEPDPERLARLRERVMRAAGIAHVEALLREAVGR